MPVPIRQETEGRITTLVLLERFERASYTPPPWFLSKSFSEFLLPILSHKKTIGRIQFGGWDETIWLNCSLESTRPTAATILEQ